MRNISLSSVFRRFCTFFYSPDWRVRVGAVTVATAMLSAFATFMILTGRTALSPTHNVVVTVLTWNGVLVVFLILLIGIEFLRLWRAWRSGEAGAWLQGHFVALFSFLVMTPAIILAVGASITLDTGLDYWFSGRTQAVIQNSTSVAYAYMREHTIAIRRNMSAVAEYLDIEKQFSEEDIDDFSNILMAQMLRHTLDGIYVIDDQYKIIASYTRDLHDNFLVPPSSALQRAKVGEAVILTPGLRDDADEIGALVKLRNYDSAYLYVVRRLNPLVIQHIREAAIQATEYQAMTKYRYRVQLAFALMYGDIALTLLFSAIWTALWFSNRLVNPIKQLIGAARLVSDGDLDTRVQVCPRDGELAKLTVTFNAMISQLKTQRNELLQKNVALDNRHRFIEAVVAGVTSGVVGIDAGGRIELINRSAEMFLNLESKNLVGLPLEQQIPEIRDILETVLSRGHNFYQGQVTMLNKGLEKTVTIRVTSKGDQSGYVVTLDDITELVAAQRVSAWRDIARRIAHEMKNPLTPIQLSAERLKRRYGKMIINDRDVFDQCIDTIIRQVSDIGRMVDEFSTFARMPKAVMEETDMVAIVRESVFLFTVSNPEINIEVIATEEKISCICDRRLISQMITNLVKNSSEALARVEFCEGSSPWIEVRIESDDKHVFLIVTDNGCGLPSEDSQKLLEPYVTRTEKGTGLGLAIVHKIAQDHKGRILLLDRSQVVQGGHGAQVIVTLLRWSESPSTMDVWSR